MCLFGVPVTAINVRHLNFWKTAILGPILTGLSFFAAENRFNMGMLQYKLPLIVI